MLSFSSSLLAPIDAKLHLAARKGGHFIATEDLSTLLPDACRAVSQLVKAQNAPTFARLQESGMWLVHDPRVRLDDNSIDAPRADGGGFTTLLTDGATVCANAPRTFLNADKCVLSSAPYACGSTTAQAGIQIDINEKSIMDLGALGGRYLYAVVGLPVVDGDGRKIPHPCTVGYRSRWEVQAGKTCTRCKERFLFVAFWTGSFVCEHYF